MNSKQYIVSGIVSGIVALGVVQTYVASMDFRVGTSTTCSLTGPSATSSELMSISVYGQVATNTNAKWVFFNSRKENFLSTTSAGWLGEINVNYKQKVLSLVSPRSSSTTIPSAANSNWSFGTSSNVIVELQTANTAGANALLAIGSVGKCVAEWRTPYQ